MRILDVDPKTITEFLQRMTLGELGDFMAAADEAFDRDDATDFRDMEFTSHAYFEDESPEVVGLLVLPDHDAIAIAMRDISPRLRRIIGPGRAETVGETAKPMTSDERYLHDISELVLRNVATLRWAEDRLRKNLGTSLLVGRHCRDDFTN
jgi:hypothetical protein